MEESAVSSKRGLNDDFVEQFSAINIELTTSDIDGWFHADGLGYGYLDEQGIFYLVSVAEGNECDEEKDANENTELDMTKGVHYPIRMQCNAKATSKSFLQGGIPVCPSEGCTFSQEKLNKPMRYLNGRTGLGNRGSREDEACTCVH